jgi:2-keto-4-pentenoate hydratase/2-oxohepta-3-ene-1,7-dioic acid hydratase in catechol pathway
VKLIRFGAAGRELPGVELADGVRVDVSPLLRDFDEAFFAGDGIARLRQWIADHAHNATTIPPGERLGAPFARPSKIVCIGLNYRDHAAESNMPLPSEPVIFFKATTAMTGPADDIIIPKGASKLDWEVELAVVIGQRAAHVTRDAALDHVAGYVLHNDYSERSFQLERGGQWVKGKSADTFAPFGPWLVTADEIEDPQNLAMWLRVNGTPLQASNSANMIFDVATLVSYVSEFMTLLPGDVISTGTPAGVGMGIKPQPRYLRPGDIVELGIDKLGVQRQRVVPYTESQ